MKDLASSDSGINPNTIKSISHRILELNRLGVINHDIRGDNFKDSKLVDFGSSRTIPHIFDGNLSDKNADAERVADRTMLEDVAVEMGIPGVIHPVHSMELRRRR